MNTKELADGTSRWTLYRVLTLDEYGDAFAVEEYDTLAEGRAAFEAECTSMHDGGVAVVFERCNRYDAIGKADAYLTLAKHGSVEAVAAGGW